MGGGRGAEKYGEQAWEKKNSNSKTLQKSVKDTTKYPKSTPKGGKTTKGQNFTQYSKNL